jgi:twitching motility protein PilI
MSRRQNLVEFQHELARRLNDAPARAAVDALLAISLGGQPWLIKLTDIAEVLSCPPIETVPWTQAWFRGATNFRGQVYSVVDLAAFVGAPAVVDLQAARLLLLNRSVARGCALLVGQVLGMRNPAAFRLADTSSDGRSWVKSEWCDDESITWHELDLRALTAHPEFLDVSR